MYPKGDLNRIWLVLGAIDALERATLLTITNSTGMPKGSVNDVLKKLLSGQVAGVCIKKEGAVYSIENWADFRLSIKEIFDENACRLVKPTI
jgi:hypothetical protein